LTVLILGIAQRRCTGQAKCSKQEFKTSLAVSPPWRILPL
jgi:hypothetical protein